MARFNPALNEFYPPVITRLNQGPCLDHQVVSIAGYLNNSQTPESLTRGINKTMQEAVQP